MNGTIRGSLDSSAATTEAAESTGASLSSTRWLIPLPIYLGIIAVFLLPFVSVSCGSQKTEPLTGADLLGGNIEWVAQAHGNAAEQRNVEKAVGDLSARARVAFVLTVAVVIVLLGLGLPRRTPDGLPIVLVFAAMAAPLAYLALFVGLFSVMSEAPTVHHHFGLYLAVALGVIGLVVSVVLFQESERAKGSPLPGKALGVGIAIYLLVALLVFVGNLSIFDNDSRWEDTSEYGMSPHAGPVTPLGPSTISILVMRPFVRV